MYTRVLVGLDGSAGSWRALNRAMGIALADHASLFGLFVEVPLWSLPPIGRDIFMQLLSRTAHGRATREGVRLEMRSHKGYPAETIVREAIVLACDLIVLGHTSDAAIRRLYYGSVSERVQQMARCKTIVVDGDQVRETERSGERHLLARWPPPPPVN
jgi:nucleotide-binding universal stress UspA family protein